MKEYPKFEKVDAHTIKIILEKSDNVSLAQVMVNRKKLLEQKAMIEETLKNVEELIAEAKKLGITPRKRMEFPNPKEEKKNG